MAAQPGDEDLLASWRSEATAVLEGWDFSSLAGRLVEEEPPWSYPDLARRLLRTARHVLDMGTGGGETLLGLADVLPEDTVATEGWPPNLPVARRNLAPHGIDVVAYDAEVAPSPPGGEPGRAAWMPFPAGRFDLVLNRHEAYDSAEVFRVLEPGGALLTQQVDGRDFEESVTRFGREERYTHVNLATLCVAAERAGFEVEQADEWSGTARFRDVGAMVRYFALAPWEVPEGFTVDRYADVLLDLHRRGPRRGEPITFTMRRCYLLARKPVAATGSS